VNVPETPIEAPAPRRRSLRWAALAALALAVAAAARWTLWTVGLVAPLVV
jgi:hypothetical protein